MVYDSVCEDLFEISASQVCQRFKEEIKMRVIPVFYTKIEKLCHKYLKEESLSSASLIFGKI